MKVKGDQIALMVFPIGIYQRLSKIIHSFTLPEHLEIIIKKYYRHSSWDLWHGRHHRFTEQVIRCTVEVRALFWTLSHQLEKEMFDRQKQIEHYHLPESQFCQTIIFSAETNFLLSGSSTNKTAVIGSMTNNVFQKASMHSQRLTMWLWSMVRCHHMTLLLSKWGMKKRRLQNRSEIERC